MKSLESDGIEIGEHKFQVNVLGIAGDNLGSHWLGGFVTNFGMSEHVDFVPEQDRSWQGDQVSACADEIWTIQTYKACIKQLADENILISQGVKFDSIFNRLHTFHVCNPGLPPGVAYDLFQGVVSYDLPIFIKHFVNCSGRSRQHGASKLTVNKLYERLECFSFSGSDARVKSPQLNPKLERLTGSASQNWCLPRIIPLLLEDLIDSDDEVYQCMLL